MLFLILIDGLNYEVFKRLFEEGKLPNLRRYLFSELHGVWGEALTTFPSATAPSLPEMLTGKYCYWHKKMPRKIHAFDRVKAEIYRYEFLDDAWVNETGDLFDLVKKRRGEVLSSFKGSFKRTTTNYYNDFFYGLDAITNFSSLDVFNYDELVVLEITRILAKNPSGYGMVFLYLGTVDMQGHFHGPEEASYANGVIELDNLLGTFFSKLRQIPWSNGSNLFEDSHFIVCGDHGMMQTGNYLDIARLFHNLQIPSLDLSRVFALIKNKLMSNWASKLDLMVVPGGSSVAELYLRNYNDSGIMDWRTRPDLKLMQSYPARDFPKFRFDIIAQLAAIQNLDLILVEEVPNVFRVISPTDGIARIYRKGDQTNYRFLYQVMTPDYLNNPLDPLGYSNDRHTKELVFWDPTLNTHNFKAEKYDDFFIDTAKWLSLTFHAQKPLAVPLIPKSFSTSATRSDIIITSRKGFNFMKISKGDHGDLSRESMMTPLILAGPKINASAELGPVRLIDLYPTMLTLMDFAPNDYPQYMDGKLLRHVLR